MAQKQFWKTKTLPSMTREEWESLCDGCGQCCLNKILDESTNIIYYTNVACNQLNLQTCQCKHYEYRFQYEPDCMKLAQKNLEIFEWLPKTCAYRLLSENQPLRNWHPLLTGSRQAMHDALISVKNKVIHEKDIQGELEDYIIDK